jgi:hypothetical protein
MRCVLSNRATLAPESWRDFPIRIAGLEGKTLSELESEVFAELLQGDLLRRLWADWEYIGEYTDAIAVRIGSALVPGAHKPTYYKAVLIFRTQFALLVNQVGDFSRSLEVHGPVLQVADILYLDLKEFVELVIE